MQKTYPIRVTILLFGLLFSVGRIFAQEWVVPDDKKQKVSPVKFNDEVTKKGEDVFKKNCTSCHGEPTKGNFVKLTPEPGDPATDKFQKQTDGALFYKITTGRSPMPEFKNVLSDDERWQVIAYFRGFNKSYVQPEPVLAPSGKYGGLDIKANLQLLPDKNLRHARDR